MIRAIVKRLAKWFQRPPAAVDPWLDEERTEAIVMGERDFDPRPRRRSFWEERREQRERFRL